MVYDNTRPNFRHPFGGVKGFAICEFESNIDGYPQYEIYTDDGMGNGDFVCTSSDLNWIQRIANLLDESEPR